MKISIVTKTLRIHDNPFLDSDIYIIYVPKREYGIHQKKFLDNILELHILDLEDINIEPIILNNLSKIKKFIKKYKEEEVEIFIDYLNPTIKYPFDKEDLVYMPAWGLIDWTDKVELIQEWFLPEALKNHAKFKQYAHSNKRDEYKVSKKKSNTGIIKKYKLK